MTHYNIYIDSPPDLYDVESYILEHVEGERPARFVEYDSKGVYVQHGLQHTLGDVLMTFTDEKFDEILDEYKKNCKFECKLITLNDLDIVDLLSHPVVMMRQMGLARLSD
jgi:hypothetical protein